MSHFNNVKPRRVAVCRFRHCSWFFVPIVASLLVSCQKNGIYVFAKKDEGTEAPTITQGPSTVPSFAPSLSPTNFPTSSPTSSPTDAPTSSPTYFPTTTPSFGPTSQPSMHPSLKPSSSPTTTFSPTEEVVPTDRPTSMPSDQPTAPPPTSPPRARVALPRMAIEFNLNDNESSGTFLKRLEDELDVFIENVLDRNGSVQNFVSVELVFQIIQEVLRGRRSRTRRLATFVRVEIQGDALFDESNKEDTPKSTPTTEELEKILHAYFSFWGTEDLQDHLQSFGLSSTDELRVFLDDEPVEVLTEVDGGGNEGGNGDRGTTDGASNGQNSKSKDGPQLKTGVLIALVAAAVFIPFAVALVIFQGKKWNSRGTHNRRPRREAGDTSGTSDRVGGKPKSTLSNPPTSTSSNQDRNHGGQDFDDGISIDNSLYTTDNTIVSMPHRATPPKSYDAKRLDKVIAAAKQHSSGRSVKS